MSNTNFIVIMIVSTSTKIRIHKCISNNWHRPLDERMDTVLKVKLIVKGTKKESKVRAEIESIKYLSNKMVIARIIWVYGHCNIPKHRFNSSSSKQQVLRPKSLLLDMQ
uniref:Candidate secreted effector n=1 Tax=Meloidogyne incognita TaxID=6306 RepID=A0A914NPU1_MELIC